MSNENPINQTNLALAAISACFAKAMEKHNPGFKDDFIQELENCYCEIRNSEISHIGAMETITWTKEFTQNG